MVITHGDTPLRFSYICQLRYYSGLWLSICLRQLIYFAAVAICRMISNLQKWIFMMEILLERFHQVILLLVVTTWEMAHMILLLMLEDFLWGGGRQIVAFGDRPHSSRNYFVQRLVIVLRIWDECFSAVLAGCSDRLSWCLIGIVAFYLWRLHLMEKMSHAIRGCVGTRSLALKGCCHLISISSRWMMLLFCRCPLVAQTFHLDGICSTLLSRWHEVELLHLLLATVHRHTPCTSWIPSSWAGSMGILIRRYRMMIFHHHSVQKGCMVRSCDGMRRTATNILAV